MIKHTIYKRLGTFAALLALVVPSAMALDVEVQPGTLETLLKTTPVTDGALTLTGQCDVRDLIVASEIPDLHTLDLSGVDILAFKAIKDVYMGLSVFSANAIPQYLFIGSHIESLTLPAGLMSIGEGAFTASKITSLDLPLRLTTIGDYAFKDCADLAEVTFNTQLKTLGKSAFEGCSSLKSVNMSSTLLTGVPERCFAGDTKLADIQLPSSVKSIGSMAFAQTVVRELALPDGVTCADFALADMTRLRTLTGSISKSGIGQFYNDTVLTSVDAVPIDLPDLHFANCKVISLDDMLGNVRTIGRMSLADTSVGMIVLGPSLYYVDDSAFSGMTPFLTAIDARSLGTDVPMASETAFYGIDQKSVELLVDQANLDVWQNAEGWNRFKIVTHLTGVVNAVADEEIRLVAANGMLSVSSPSPVTDLAVYDLSGMLLAQASPSLATFTVELPASAAESRVLIVVVGCNGKTRSFKLVY